MEWLGLTGKCVMVTGGALGIGRAIVNGLAEVGANIVIADFNEEVGAAAAAEVNQSFEASKAVFVKCNVADKSMVDDAVAAAVKEFGRLDVLVNNAGINIPRLLLDPDGKEELTEDVWDKVVTINMKGQFLCAQSAARAMLKDGKGGVIIMTNSESGMEGSEGQSVYAATKAAGYNLCRSWAKELGKHGIRVVGIAPGIMEATALRNDEYERALAYTRGISVDDLRASYENVSIPLARAGKLSEVADLVVFLASDRGAYIHGTTVNISGGKSRA